MHSVMHHMELSHLQSNLVVLLDLFQYMYQALVHYLYLLSIVQDQLSAACSCSVGI